MKFLAVPGIMLLVLCLQGLPGGRSQEHEVCQKDTCNIEDLQLYCLTGGTVVYGECSLKEAICSPEAKEMGITLDPTAKCVDCRQFPNRPWC